MHVVSETRNLAARAGRWSAQHRKTAIWGWVVFVLFAFALGGAAGTVEQEQAQSGVGESGRASSLARRGLPEARQRGNPDPRQHRAGAVAGVQGGRRRRAAPPVRGRLHASGSKARTATAR